MAESSGWLDGWLQAAKTKAVESFDMVRKDLTEFSSTMQTDTIKAASDMKGKLTQENMNAATQKAKAGVTNLLGEITKVLHAEPEVKEKRKPVLSAEVMFDRVQARLHAIQVDPSTYLDSPSGDENDYKLWLETFDIENRKGIISDLLVRKAELRSLFTQLVPSQVSHQDFWRRYFYKVHQLEEDNRRRADLMKRAEVKDEEMTWDDEEDWDNLLDSPLVDTSPAETGDTTPVSLNETCDSSTKIVTEIDVISEVPTQTRNLPADPKLTGNALTQTVPADLKVPTLTQTVPADLKVPTLTQTIPADLKLSTGESDDATQQVNTVAKTPDVGECVAVKEPIKVSAVAGEPLSASAHSTTKANVTDSTSIVREDEKLDIRAIICDTPVEPEGPASQCTDTVEPVQEREPNDCRWVQSVARTHSDAPIDCKLSPSDTVSLVKLPALEVTSEEELSEIKMKERGELVVIGSDTSSPLSTESLNTAKETDSDDWEKEFEVTEDDLKLAQESGTVLKTESTPIVRHTSSQEPDSPQDDWEAWD